MTLATGNIFKIPVRRLTPRDLTEELLLHQIRSGYLRGTLFLLTCLGLNLTPLPPQPTQRNPKTHSTRFGFTEL
jgi:hypothetical protein